ncbi:MAG: hypothetical protein GYB65_05595 [Chloroflexi bacterium]|nr:hypothetical protein [Chloroflexota bacterium]
MALIDQRILIDAPPEAVWQILADPTQLAHWHSGYTSVTLLTPDLAGQNSRRRCILPNGKAVVEHVTAWIDGLGYEYAIVDGGPYRSFRGRLRLQAGPDGTNVHWTVSYQPGGFLGGLRDRLGGRRKLTAMLAASLRQLRHQVDTLGQRMDTDQRARLGVRERMDVDQRAHYQRRHPAPPLPDPTHPPTRSQIPDPHRPFAPDAPRQAPSDAVPPPPVVPSFVAELTRDNPEPDYSHTADTKPKPPPGFREAVAEMQARAAAEGEATSNDSAHTEQSPERTPERTADHTRVTPARGTPTVQPSDAAPAVEAPQAAPAPASQAFTEAETDVEKPAFIPPPPLHAPESTPAEKSPQQKRGTIPEALKATPPGGAFSGVGDLTGENAPSIPPQTPQTDTGEISIWEVFGVQRPSEVDGAALEDLVQSVQAREARQRREAGASKRPARVRRISSEQAGLRLSQPLHRARVRRRTTGPEPDNKKPAD